MSTSTTTPLDSLTPAIFWQYFRQICAIPHNTKHEASLRNFFKLWAEQHGINYYEDAIGNLYLRKPANTPALAHKPSIAIQAHLDMVCVSRDPQQDLQQLQPQPIVSANSKYVQAQGTTLGADNGVGLAAILALFSDPTLQHGPLEALLTVEEEVNMIGAANLEPQQLQSKYLINTDGFSWGQVNQGCMGSNELLISKTNIEYSYINLQSSFYLPVLLTVTNGAGGHSGFEIHKNITNTARLALDLVADLADVYQLQLTHLSAGVQANVIPSTSQIGFVIPYKDQQAQLEILVSHIHRLATQYVKVYQNQQDQPTIVISTQVNNLDPKTNGYFTPYYAVRLQTDGTVQATRTPKQLAIAQPRVASFDRVLTAKDSQQILRLLQALPNGVVKYSDTLPASETSYHRYLAETSISIGRMSLVFERDIPNCATVQYTTLVRATSNHSLDYVRTKITHLAQLANFSVIKAQSTACWEKSTGKFTEFFLQQYQIVHPEPLKLVVTPSSIEAGYIKQANPEVEIVSFGPEILGAHTTSERVNIATVAGYYQLLQNVITQLPDSLD